MQGNDLDRVVISHPSLNHEIVVQLQNLDELNPNTVIETVENLLSSNEDLAMDDDFDISIGTIEIPTVKKHYTGYVNNTNDTSCSQRSISYAWAKMNHVRVV